MLTNTSIWRSQSAHVVAQAFDLPWLFSLPSLWLYYVLFFTSSVCYINCVSISVALHVKLIQQFVRIKAVVNFKRTGQPSIVHFQWSHPIVCSLISLLLLKNPLLWHYNQYLFFILTNNSLLQYNNVICIIYKNWVIIQTNVYLCVHLVSAEHTWRIW